MRTAPLRAIGVGQNAFANEVFMDEIAEKLGVDPVAVPAAQSRSTRSRARAHVDRGSRRGWPTGAGSAPGRGLGFAYLDYSGTQVAGVAEVSVDAQVGAIKVHEFWCAIDAGVAVQPDNVIAQTESSIVYGLGLALTERITIEDGTVKQSNFYDYHVPRMNDLPRAPHQADPDARTIRPARGRWRRRSSRPRSRTRCISSTGVRLRQQPMLRRARARWRWPRRKRGHAIAPASNRFAREACHACIASASGGACAESCPSRHCCRRRSHRRRLRDAGPAAAGARVPRRGRRKRATCASSATTTCRRARPISRSSTRQGGRQIAYVGHHGGVRS